MLSQLNIIYEDDILLVCNKPAGLMVEPDRNNFPNLLQDVKKYLKEKTGEKLPYAQHLHRLDRPVSGIVLFTKKKDFLRNLSEQFAKRQVLKQYTALTLNAPKKMEDTLEQWHRKEKKKAVIVSEDTEFAEKIKLDYTVNPFTNFYAWNINLHTGKFHQIRIQLSNLGCPILGDELYGSSKIYKDNAIALCASKLTVKHPLTQVEMTFEVKPDFI